MIHSFDVYLQKERLLYALFNAKTKNPPKPEMHHT